MWKRGMWRRRRRRRSGIIWRICRGCLPTCDRLDQQHVPARYIVKSVKIILNMIGTYFFNALYVCNA
jgi:hypothetical protein